MKRTRKYSWQGFTLVELMVVIAIIGMLGTFSIGVMRISVETARESRTRTTIGKLDSVITSMYEKYQNRRVDVSSYQKLGWPGGVSDVNYIPALWRLWILRDTIRMDMPMNYAEVINGPVVPDGSGGCVNDGTGNRSRSALNAVYNRAVNNCIDINDPTTYDAGTFNAELLYLIVTNGDPESRSMFSDREVADTNNNGLLEFVDGWGKPINWLRWAPGLESSDRQPVFGAKDEDGYLYTSFTSYADPLDPLGAEQVLLNNENYNGWLLIPYIYSSGPDGERGVYPLVADDGEIFSDPFARAWNEIETCPGAPDGTGENQDNIHNHNLTR